MSSARVALPPNKSKVLLAAADAKKKADTYAKKKADAEAKKRADADAKKEADAEAKKVAAAAKHKREEEEAAKAKKAAESEENERRRAQDKAAAAEREREREREELLAWRLGRDVGGSPPPSGAEVGGCSPRDEEAERNGRADGVRRDQYEQE
eukprot:scaffold11348_cov123-Isochrysis_galbana.AAC.1